MPKRATASERRHMQRFWSKVDRRSEDECWPWLGTRVPKGYGQLWVDGRNRPATHIALAIAGHARCDEKPYALHSCDNPACVNPSHLRWGTAWENMNDRRVRGRENSLRGELHQNSKFTNEQVLTIRNDTRPVSVLASAFGVSKAAIRRIRSGARWGHLQCL